MFVLVVGNIQIELLQDIAGTVRPLCYSLWSEVAAELACKTFAAGEVNSTATNCNQGSEG